MIPASTKSFNCHACGNEVTALPSPALQFLVGSDCTPVTGNIRVGACPACGLMQKEISPDWAKLCEQIYGNYRIYHQAAGNEQKARDNSTGEFKPRSELIAGYLHSTLTLPDAGSVLDIGSGNGAYLRAMSKIFPRWTVTGTDLNDTFREEICAICSRAAFLNSGELAISSTSFDIVSLIHCLEHIPSPVAYLSEARRLIKQDGLLLIEVPDAELNPFDLVVADHSSHLSKATLAAIVTAAGYEVIECGNLVVGKEITLLARPLHGKAVAPMCKPEAGATEAMMRNLAWLQATKEQAHLLRQQYSSFGVFGTSIAGVWIGSALGFKLDFYVDEDKVRIGRNYFDIPIIDPTEVPDAAIVFVCLEPSLAAAIAERHKADTGDFMLPPPLFDR